jgi:hypothetical protein
MTQENRQSESAPVPLAYAGPVGRPMQWLHVAVWAAIAVLLLLMIWPTRRQSHDHPPELRCRSNLRQIGMGVMMYANENNGSFPDDFETIVLTQEMTSDVFVCAASNDTSAVGPTTRAVAAQLSAGGHLSYVYTGKALTSESPANAVVAYERPGNHPGCFNVLRADGRVDRLTPQEGQKLLAELKAGHNPPRAERLKEPVASPTSAPSNRAGESESR